ncbi:MAG TPA: L,D-transpeptidase family protein [Thermoanaerobaculia bacterium]|nr:L,D-transpeptidase family protein [Thermoanaerobaculia bacterium]
MILPGLFAVVTLTARLSSDPIVAGGERICAAASVRTFYARRNGAVAWTDGDVAALRRAIDAVRDDGLDPALYHRRLLSTNLSSDDREILATDAFCFLAAHLQHGRVEPEFLLPAWCREPDIDAAAVLQAALDAHLVDAALQRLAPRHEAYRTLKTALADYRRIERDGGWAALPPGPPLRRGDRNGRVAALRQRLGLPAGDVFDDDVERALRDFQVHHGLDADGVAGAATRRELNVPVAARIEQLALNLERWRWMPDVLGASYVVVNIAAFRLQAFENGRAVVSMKTVVGKEFTKTPFFAARITDVVVNPPWNVPDSIAAKELWPKQRRDRRFFAREHLEITPDGRLRQTSGPWNSLGRLKFNMPNGHDVYLHDTPAKSLFDLSVRAFSHGCIRVERPLDLAAWLFRAQPEWSVEALQAAIAAGAERSIALRAGEPVYVLYWTASVADDGRVVFQRDVYNRDAALARALGR